MKPSSLYRRFDKALSTLVLACLVCYSGCAQANFAKALEIYNAGNYPEAEAAFEALAAIGDRSSMFNLGVMYYRGEIGDRDSVRAYVMMKYANEGIADPAFQKTTNSIFSTLSEQQKGQAETLWIELQQKYDAAIIRDTIFPVLLDDEDCAPEPRAHVKVTPRYPTSELRTGRMGITYLELTISPQGYPRDITVIDSTNRRFSKASVKALRQSLYPPTADSRAIFGHRYAFTYHIGGPEEDSSITNANEIERNLKTLQAAANSGDVFAQYRYGYQLNIFRQFQSYLKDIDLQYRSANEWFIKSAENGLPRAQFEVGRNMMVGRGCELDEVNGFKWVKAAAIAGYSPAQRMLAQATLTDKELSENKTNAAVSWLRNAALSDDYSAKLMLAWELATSPDPSIRSGAEALAMLEEKPNKYFDELRILETKAAAYAETGEFKKAIKLQKKALKLSQKADWDIPLVRERLGLYEHQEPYRGTYY